MKKIDVISGEQKLDGEKIRYIEINQEKFIIYTLNEIDNDGYEKLYMNKFIDNEEDLISDINWDKLKKEIPNIVKQIRNKAIVDFKDLNTNEINKVDLNYARAFKLKVSIVDSIKKEDEVEVDLGSELNDLLGEISNNQKDNVDDLDSFLENIESNNETTKDNVEINNNNSESQFEIEQLKEELNRQKKTNELLQNKIIELEIELNKYKEKLNQIKIMIEES